MNSASDIAKSMDEHPDQWTVDYFHVRHKSGLALWVANGLPFLKADRSAIDFGLGFFGKHRVWRAYNRLRVRRVREMLEKVEVKG